MIKKRKAIAGKTIKRRPVTKGWSKALIEIPGPASGLKFRDGKFDGLNIPVGLKYLLPDSNTFPEHKEVLLAGFVAWLITPNSERNIADAVILETFRQYALAETGKNPKPTRSEMWLTGSRIMGEARFLIERIYYPIGAAAAIRAAYTRASAKASEIEAALPEVRFLISMAKVLHHHARKLVAQRGKISQRN